MGLDKAASQICAHLREEPPHPFSHLLRARSFCEAHHQVATNCFHRVSQQLWCFGPRSVGHGQRRPQPLPHTLSALPRFWFASHCLGFFFNESKIGDIGGLARWVECRLAPQSLAPTSLWVPVPFSVHDPSSPVDRSRHCRSSRQCNRRSFHWLQWYKSPSCH